MDNADMKIKGTYLIGAYICLLAMMLIAESSMLQLSNIAQFLALPILTVFFYINTAIDSRFEKNIFYGIVLFALSRLLTLAHPVLGNFTVYIIIALWIIALFAYSRAIISITSISSTLLFQKKWLAGILFIGSIIILYVLLSRIELGWSKLIPFICFGLASTVLLMVTVNLQGQISTLLFGIFMTGTLLLIGYNSLVILNFSSNISIFDSGTALLFYLGQLLIIFGAVKSSLSFRSDDNSDISGVLKKSKN